MLSKNLYVKTFIRILLILITCLALALSILKNQIGIAILLGVILSLQTISIINFFNTTNRKLTFFFNALENSDTTVSFSEDTNNTILNQLNNGLNRVNNIIKEERYNTQVQEQYYKTLLSCTNVGILSVNLYGHILFANESVKQLLNCNVLTHIKQLKKVNIRLYNLISNLKPFEQQLISLTNERTTAELKITAKLVEIKEVSVLLVSIQNIYNELDTKQVDSWMGLIKVMSHEIMNALAPITSISESLSKMLTTEKDTTQTSVIKASDLKKLNQGLSVIHEQSKSLKEFVTGYRALTKIPKPNKTIIKVPELFKRTIVIFQEDPKCKNIKFQTNTTPSDLEIFADEHQIKQVLLNLTKNAVDALDEFPNAIIKLEGIKNTLGNIEILVKDNGMGILEEDIHKIFTPFYTNKENGTGIGLSLSKHIMQLHQGSLMVKSIPKKETVFTLTLNSF
ncbi:PAS domain-containing sensor histidine kinase [Seonamhaeicola sp. ML3]|uniref:sensor histidine kinase n=1 Tax=Seonamhaeicola sp. ML3 TaxID=2937786 RepID=UPI00200D1AA8|nr:HAMP domain-containing sensor histidine kinase [Seonamhaeicola sp. ML3]